MELELVAVAQGKIIGLVTLEEVKVALKKDRVMVMLRNQVQSGFPPENKLLVEELKPFWRQREELSVVEGLVMFKDRLVIPGELRKVVLEMLHSAHQGVYNMQLSAEKSVWWPGMTPDIKQARNRCTVCHEVAPSQSRGPPIKTPDPEYPLQLVCADHFELKGKFYFVVVDWTGSRGGQNWQAVATPLEAQGQ